jgi:CRISPR-associated protein Cas2
VKKAKDSGAVMQIWTDQNPQGFSYRQSGERDRRFIDLDGLALVEFKRAVSDGNSNFSDTRTP